MANWKTTVSALVSAAGMFVLFGAAPPYNIHFPVGVMALAGFMALGGLASLGINGKDNNVTGAIKGIDMNAKTVDVTSHSTGGTKQQ